MAKKIKVVERPLTLTEKAIREREQRTRDAKVAQKAVEPEKVEE